MSLNFLIQNFIKSNSVDAEVGDKEDDNVKVVNNSSSHGIYVDDSATDNVKGQTKGKKQSKPKAQTVTQIKSNPELKNLSKYIRGGLSKMTKTELTTLIDGLSSYKKHTYTVGGKEIIPDKEQELIIKAPINKNIRVVAGAGTGKTTTITCRVKYLLDTCTTPDKILILTFNVESRKNLETMIDRMMGFEIKVEIRTIDSFCLKIKNDFYADYVINNTPEGEEQSTNRSLSEFGVVGRKIMEKYGAEIASQYKYVFFDEFQDVDEDQFEILRGFVKNGCFLTVIGDDSQNIYQFRGSDNYYIINFDKIIPNTLTYKITTNYRSTKEIVDLANDSIHNNKDKIFKLMKNHTEEKGDIDLTILDNDNDVVDHIIQMIIHYVEDHGYDYSDIAILSRSTHPLKCVETEFERNKLPYVALISDQYSNEYKQIIQQNKIVLSTIHKAKGLEWKVVFLIGLCDNYFPSHLNNGLKNIEEERRLFYVGTTRAKRHLHFVTDVKSIPLSRFIGEIVHHVGEIQNKTGRHIEESMLFLGDDANKIKESYSVMDIVEMMNGRRIEKLRGLKLIPSSPVKTTQVFTDPIYFTDEIKKHVFESDYGIYCDYYMIRQLMIINKQNIKDMHVEKILLDLHLTDEERVIYHRYNIKECLIKGQPPKIDPKNTREIKLIKELVEKLGNTIKLAKLPPHCVEYLLSMGVSDYQYPRKFMKQLRRSYNIYKEPLRCSTNDLEILDSIYHVSLCPKLNNDRRRLVYKNVMDMYTENSKDVLPRINEYVKKIEKNEILCKLQMNKMYKIDKETIDFVGELDYIDITNNTIVDLKCSEGDFKIEWLIQLLLYYSLFMCNPNCCDNYYDIEINKVAIINIFSGKYYEIDLPENYDWQKLLEFVRELISNDIKGIREERDPELTGYLQENANKVELKFVTDGDMQDILDVPQEEVHTKVPSVVIEFDRSIERSGYMVLDVENNSTNMDIIQIAYIIYDDLNKELKRVNRYIKDRFVDSRTNQITGITTDILRSKGVEFVTVMKEFVADLTSVKVLCGHHVHTDVSKLALNMEKFGVVVKSDDSEINIFEDVEVQDTSVMFKDFKRLTMNLKTSSSNGSNTDKAKPRTSATLQGMFADLFNKQMKNAHDALSDVEHTAKCYVELKKRLSKIPQTESSISKIPSKKLFNKSKGDSDSVGDVDNTDTLSIKDDVDKTTDKTIKKPVKKTDKTPVKKAIRKADTDSSKELQTEKPKRVIKASTEKSETPNVSAGKKPGVKKGLALDTGLSSIMSQSYF